MPTARDDDVALLTAFRDLTLPRPDWTHRAHVRTTWLHLREAPYEDALPRLREGIKTLNLSLGNQNTADAGYHETMTAAFLRLIRAAIHHHPAPQGTPESSIAFCDRHPHLLSPTVLSLYYSQLRLMSRQARAEFVEPDIAPLPAP